MSVMVCMNGDLEENPSVCSKVLLTIWISAGTIFFIAAFALDIMLASIIKKRSQVQPLRMISWSTNAQVKPTIPLRSSFNSLIYFSIGLGCGFLSKHLYNIILTLAGSMYVPVTYFEAVHKIQGKGCSGSSS